MVLSSIKSHARKLCEAGDTVKDLSNELQHICIHYTYYKDPDDPVTALQERLKNWHLDKKEEAPPVENVTKSTPGGSAASYFRVAMETPLLRHVRK